MPMLYSRTQGRGGTRCSLMFYYKCVSHGCNTYRYRMQYMTPCRTRNTAIVCTSVGLFRALRVQTPVLKGGKGIHLHPSILRLLTKTASRVRTERTEGGTILGQ